MNKINLAGFVCKLVFICLVVIFILWNWDIETSFSLGKQNFDIISAAVISLGFGLTLCLILYGRRIHN
jgi:hypothetical protein